MVLFPNSFKMSLLRDSRKQKNIIWDVRMCQLQSCNVGFVLKGKIDTNSYLWINSHFKPSYSRVTATYSVMTIALDICNGYCCRMTPPSSPPLPLDLPSRFRGLALHAGDALPSIPGMVEAYVFGEQ